MIVTTAGRSVAKHRTVVRTSLFAKQRHGPIGTVRLHFEAETTKFDNFIGPEHLPTAEY